VTTAMRMLDNVIDINFYPVDKARRSNERHRPVGMGIMGFQDCLYEMSVPYSSDAAVSFADKSMEAVAYYAYLASSKLAAERGSYPSYSGSLWSQGILPQDTIQALANSRKGYLQMTTEPTERLDWEIVRKSIDINGMRNSNCLAIAPTATISNIIGVSQSIEPTYQNLYVKSNLSGEFTEINEHLVAALKKLNLWDETMIADLKYFDGSLLKIERIPAQVKELYATAFEVETKWLIEAASSRQIWIDQAQSLNLYMAQPSGKKLDEMYKLAWLRGLKTTYYLRSLGATSAEKSTSRAGALNAVQSAPVHVPEPEVMGRACAIDAGPECESCQ
jgi:ribonucleoside-diphosphate reductase alpha chain